MQTRTLLYYQTSSGVIPFRSWLRQLDSITFARVMARLSRLEEGHFGDFKNLGLSVFELRIHWGPGYRIYFGLSGREVVLLLWGGDKRSQQKDIRKAHEFWQDYLRRKK